MTASVYFIKITIDGRFFNENKIDPSEFEKELVEAYPHCQIQIKQIVSESDFIYPLGIKEFHTNREDLNGIKLKLVEIIDRK